jgi:hypothetical protein
MRFTIQCTSLALAIAAVTAAPLPKPAELPSDVSYGGIGVSPVSGRMDRREPLPLNAEVVEDAAKEGGSLLSKGWNLIKNNKLNTLMVGSSVLPMVTGGDKSGSQQPAAAS